MPWAKVLLSSSKINAQPNKTKTPIHLYIIVVMWLGFTGFAAIYFITDRVVAFDPQNKLINISQTTLVNSVMAEFDLPEEMPNTLINFISEDCSCNTISKEHLSDVKNNAVKDNMSVINIILPEGLSDIIPSTPSVLALNKKSELIYFGPYSEGLSCGKGEGIIDLVMSNYKKGFNAQLIMTNSKGCYCNT